MFFNFLSNHFLELLFITQVFIPASIVFCFVFKYIFKFFFNVQTSPSSLSFSPKLTICRTFNPQNFPQYGFQPILWDPLLVLFNKSPILCNPPTLVPGSRDLTALKFSFYKDSRCCFILLGGTKDLVVSFL